jgi:Zn-dependent alcohol dehydrogenase
MKTRAAVLRKAGLCDAGLYAGVGCLPDKTFRFHRGGEDFGGMCVVGSFAEYSVFGGANPLTELITKKYALEEINEGYADLMDGKNLRGVVVHQH